MEGNLGCGGSEYQMALLVTQLSKEVNNTITVFHYNKLVTFKDGIQSFIIQSLNDIRLNDISIFVINLTNQLSQSQSIALERFCRLTNSKIIFWVHCRLNYNEIIKFSMIENVKKIVFVTPLEEKLLGENIPQNKKMFIFNMSPKIESLSLNGNKGNIVVYVGNISEYKGFIYFLKEWKSIKRKVPDSELFVIGNGALYNRSNVAQFSKLNLCKAEYEDEVLHILDADNIIDSIHFMGIMGKEKNDVIQRAKVGIVTNKNIETFCITALEYQQNKVPVLALGKDGLKYTVCSSSGILCNSFKEIRENTIRILNDEIKFDYQNEFFERFYPETIIAR